jgi:hypothetical protein
MQVLRHVQERVVLWNERDRPRRLIAYEVSRQSAAGSDLACSARNGGDRDEQRRLARTGRADQGMALAARHLG